MVYRNPGKPKRRGQTEETTSGLIAKVGNYKGKTLNLSGKQLGSAGVKASRARKVDISATRYDKESKKVLGPKGQPLTGRVDLGGGNIGVYKNGVRVRATPAAPKRASGGSRASSPKPKIDNSRASRLGKPGEYQAGRGTVARNRGDTGAPKPGEYQAGRGSSSKSSGDYRRNTFPVRGGANGYAVTGNPADLQKAKDAQRAGTGARTFQLRHQISMLQREISKAKRTRELNASARKQLADQEAELRRLEKQLAALKK